MMVSKPKNNLIIILALFLWSLRFIPFIWPDGRLWGFNHLIFTDDAFFYIYALSGLLIAGALIPVVRNSYLLAMKFPAQLFERRNRFAWVLFSLASMAVFWLFRMPTNLLGDGYAVINNIGNDIPVVFKWSEIGAIKIIYFVSQLLPYEGLVRGEYAYATLSVISGGITVYFFFEIAYEIGLDKERRLLSFCLLLFSGWTLLFFGYAENYPVLWPFISAYLFFSIRYLSDRCSLVIPLIILLLALTLHLQIFFFAGTILVLLFAKAKGRKLFDRFSKQVWAGIIILMLAGILYFIWQYQTSLGFQVHFLPPFFGRPIAPDYAMFSPIHFADIINLLLLVVPLFPILVVVSIKGFKNVIKDSINLFLLVFTLGAVVFILIIDPRLGMARDWDLFALSCLGPAVLFIRLTVRQLSDSRSIPVLILLAIISTAPYIASNTSRDSSLAYFESLLEMDKSRSRSGLVMLRDYLKNQGESERAVSVNKSLIEAFPQSETASRVTRLLDARQYDNALILADSIYRINPFVVDGMNMKGMSFLRLRVFDSALYYLSQSRELARYEHRTYVNLAELYAKTGQKEKMWDNLRHAQRLNPNSLNVIQPMAMSFYADGIYDSALVYGRRLQKIAPEHKDGYLVVGLASVIYKDFITAKANLVKYLQIAPSSPQSEVARKTLLIVEERLGGAGG
ncbi:MAG: hypothetical protein KAR42_01160 [candidate division Zixibacteria bacterium]|nr:hypothetical protein [candidate division Zixibacteria bacterium]